MTQETWYLTPRDPLVLGDGRGPVPFVVRKSHPLPLPGTVAGMVRSSFVQGRGGVSPEEAEGLLDIRIGAPWLVQCADAMRGTDGAMDHWLFAPADAAQEVGAEGAAGLCQGQVLPLEADEGVLWSFGFPTLSHLIRLPERTRAGAKYQPPRQRFWPLGALVLWSLGEDPGSEAFRKALAGSSVKGGAERAQGDGSDAPTRAEQRIHVGIDDKTQTADPSILFSSAGQRLASRFAIAVEVEVPDGRAGGPQGQDWVVLGGESRLSRVVRRPGAGFPAFSEWSDAYQKALAAFADDPPTGVRLQLLSHAYLPPGEGAAGAGACLPSWVGDGRHPDLPAGLRLRLAALCIPGPVAVSGWDLQGVAAGAGPDPGQDALGRSHGGGAPRKVRRLVPAGSVYYFRLEDEDGVPVSDPDRLVAVCRGLWWKLLDPQGHGETRPAPTEHSAAAGADGYGRILPGFWWGN